MTLDLGIVMDPIGGIHPKKDSSLAMLLAAQRRGHRLHYMETADLWLRDGEAHARMRPLVVRDDPADWYTLGAERHAPLASLDVVLMRKDPPFDMQYVYATYLLERAEAAGVLVVNRPRALRDANEKVFTAWFPDCCPPTLVAREPARFREFLAEWGEIVLKPLDGMGGQSIFRVRRGDPNLTVILEAMTGMGTRHCMAQTWLPEVTEGDARVLVIDGRPVPYALARIPAQGETRANLAAGGTGVGRPLDDRDRAICAAVGPVLRERGLLFVGLDVIGGRLTEINVTSPTCIRELDAQFGLDIAGDLMAVIEARRAAAPPPRA